MIRMKIDYKDVAKSVETAAKQMPYAASVALNNTGFHVKDEEAKALDQHLDRPTPFTKRAYQVKKASKTNLKVTIEARQIQQDYLKWAVWGGSRAPSGRANVIPVNVNLNKYGNIPRNALQKIVLNKRKFFSGIPQGGGVAGIYQRMGSRRVYKGTGRRTQWLKLMVSYEGSVRYRERLPFFEVAERAALARFRREFDKAYAMAMRTAR